MTIQDEFNEILADLQYAQFSDDSHAIMRAMFAEAAQNATRKAASGELFISLADLLLLTFYVGREHHARGYAALTERDPGGIGQADAGIPDTVAELLIPNLKRYHVEFHADVLARNEEEAISNADGDDWRVREVP